MNDNTDSDFPLPVSKRSTERNLRTIDDRDRQFSKRSRETLATAYTFQDQRDTRTNLIKIENHKSKK